VGGADDVVRAAGGVPWRRAPGGELEVVLVHRPKYDDWTFPKGKLDPGETWEQAAVREVWEETGIVPVLGPELAPTRYHDRFGRAKVVRWWAMVVAADAGLPAGDEIGARRWVRLDDVPALLTYQRDRSLVEGVRAAVGATGSSSDPVG